MGGVPSLEDASGMAGSTVMTVGCTVVAYHTVGAGNSAMEDVSSLGIDI